MSKFPSRKVIVPDYLPQDGDLTLARMPRDQIRDYIYTPQGADCFREISGSAQNAERLNAILGTLRTNTPDLIHEIMQRTTEAYFSGA